MNGLDEVSRNLGPIPRRFEGEDRKVHLRVNRQWWCFWDDLSRFYRKYPKVLENGRLTWGRIIQANGALFDEGPYDHPGEVLYTEAGAATSPGLLEPITRACYDLKGTRPDDADLRTIADYLTHERIRVFGLAVPSALSGHTKCRISTTMFIRKHLPDGRLSLPYFPLLVSEAGDGVVAVVPSFFWPEDFHEKWRGLRVE